MNKQNLPRFLSSLSVAIFALTTTAAYADDDRDGDHKTKADLVISLEARTRLTPPIAPAIPGPIGSASLEARNVDGVIRAEVEVSTRGLAADTYTVLVTKKSDATIVTLGTFTVVPAVPAVVSRKRDHDDDHDKKDHDSDRDKNGSDNDHNKNGKRKIEFSTKRGTLPAGFDGFDVAAISVNNSANDVVLAGDLTRCVDLVKRARLVADVSVPNASGQVSISSTTRAGVAKSRFVLTAKGLPAATTLQLAINGVEVQTVTTDKRGRATVRVSPATVDITAIMTVTIHDAANVALLSASF